MSQITLQSEIENAYEESKVVMAKKRDKKAKVKDSNLFWKKVN